MIDKFMEIKDRKKLAKRIKREMTIVRYIRNMLILDVLGDFQQDRYVLLETEGTEDKEYLKAEGKCEGVQATITRIENYEKELKAALKEVGRNSKCVTE